MKQQKNIQNPWAGLSSYEDPAKSTQSLKFCGRDSETFDVVRLIDDNFLLTLYGKSGIGKTSLLNAGVFPVLRRELYTPLSLRLGISDGSETFQDIITTAIERTMAEEGGHTELFPVVDEQTDCTAPDYLWNWFARRRFVDAGGNVTFPAIVLDQFEEVFRQSEMRQKAGTLLAQIHYLIDESHALGDCIVGGQPYSYDFNFRFVLSIREDDLYRLEDSIDNGALTALKRCRYRLRGLTEQGAREIIGVPGKEYIKPEEFEQIVEKILLSLETKFDASELSLMCSQLFRAMKESQLTHISENLVDKNAKSSIQEFYKSAIQKFDLSKKEIDSLESEFVTDKGRRSFVSEDRYKKLFRPDVCDKLLNPKSEYRILANVNGKIEIVHDLLAKAIKAVRDEHDTENLQQMIKQEKMLCYLSLLPVVFL